MTTQDLERKILNQLRHYIEDLRSQLNSTSVHNWPEANEIYSNLIQKAYQLEIDDRLHKELENEEYLPN